MKRVFFDMDGVLAQWQDGTPFEVVCSPGYFKNLPTEQNVLNAFRLLAAEESIDLHILSAVLPEAHNTAEKQEWLQNKLGGVVKQENIHFVPVTARKSEVLGGITKEDILIDDYSKNIQEWQEDGGIAVKMFNSSNGRSGKYYGAYTCTWLDPKQIAEDIMSVVSAAEEQTGTERELIPDGGVYIFEGGADPEKNRSKRLFGDGRTVYFPEKMNDGDVYMDESYMYVCLTKAQKHWTGSDIQVFVTNVVRTSYGPLRSHVCDRKVDSLFNTFRDCKRMEVPPAIPYGVENLRSAFHGCVALKEMPKIPETVKEMDGTFVNCKALEKAEAIPKTVRSMIKTFSGCSSLKGTLICHADPDYCGAALENTDITRIEGVCSEETKADLLATK